jgi:hypothetical protein
MSAKHSRAPRASEPALPLHIALAAIIIGTFPINENHEPLDLWSSPFVAAILRILAREILEVGEHVRVSLISALGPTCRVWEPGERDRHVDQARADEDQKAQRQVTDPFPASLKGNGESRKRRELAW